MEYEIVYSIEEAAPVDFAFLGIGLFFLGIGIKLVYTANKEPQKINKGIAWAFFSFWLLWNVVGNTHSLIRHRSGLSALDSGKIEISEGTVYDFIPMPREGKALEYFKVDGNEFSYSDYRITNSFNNTSSHGGPIKDGIEVKVWHVGNKIYKLGIK